MSSATKDFDIEKFVAEEKMLLDEIAAESSSKTQLEPLKIDSTGPVQAVMDVEEEEKEAVSILYSLIMPI